MNVSALLDAAESHLSKGRDAAAEKLFLEAMEHPGGAARAAGGLGKIALRAGDLDKAHELYGRGLALAPENAGLLVGLAVVHMCAQRTDEAELCLRRAMRLDPAMPEAPCALAAVLLSQRDPDGARTMARRAIELAPDMPDTNMCLANVEMLRGDVDAARTLFEKAAELAPDRVDVRIALGTVFRMSGELARATESLERARLLEPDAPAVLAGLAECRVALGEFEAARKLVGQAVAVAPADGDVRTVEGMVLLHSGWDAEALASLRLAAQYSPQNPAPLVNLALLLRRNRQPEAALAAVRQATALGAHPHVGARRMEFDLLCLTGEWREAWRRLDELKGLGQPPGDASDLPDEGVTNLGPRLVLIVDDLSSSLLGLRLLSRLSGAERRIRLLCLPAYASFFHSLPVIDSVEAREAINLSRDIEAGETALLLDELPRLLRATPACLAPLALDICEPSEDPASGPSRPRDTPRVGLWWDDAPGGPNPQILLDALPDAPALLREPDPGQELVVAGGRSLEILVDRGVENLLGMAQALLSLDLVVAVDGPVAHLAAALGCRTVVVCQIDVPWYWQPCGPEGARWYPSAQAVARDPGGLWSSLSETCGQILSDIGACPGTDAALHD